MSHADEVEIFIGPEDRWVAGFELADVDDSGEDRRFRVRRQADGVELVDAVAAECIRPANSADALVDDG